MIALAHQSSGRDRPVLAEIARALPAAGPLYGQGRAVRMKRDDERLKAFISARVSEYMMSVEEAERLNLTCFLDLCESPIERYMGTALSYMETQSYGGRPVACWLNTDLIKDHDPKIMDEGSAFVMIAPQHPLRFAGSSYRVDFLLAVKPHHTTEKFFVVVECDGHQFHERTKEQAQRDRARDRAMTAAGFMVFRFTGAEIYRDAVSCAAEISSFLEDLSSRSWEKSETAKDFNQWIEERRRSPANDSGDF